MARFTVYEVFADNKQYLKFESDNRIDCEVYVNNHQYDRRFAPTDPNHSRLVIDDCFL